MVMLNIFKLSRCVFSKFVTENLSRGLLDLIPMALWTDDIRWPSSVEDGPFWKQWFMTRKKHEQTIVDGVDTSTYNPGAHIFSQMDGLQKYEHDLGWHLGGDLVQGLCSYNPAGHRVRSYKMESWVANKDPTKCNYQLWIISQTDHYKMFLSWYHNSI